MEFAFFFFKTEILVPKRNGHEPQKTSHLNVENHQHTMDARPGASRGHGGGRIF
jgi:hypothetical protein